MSVAVPSRTTRSIPMKKIILTAATILVIALSPSPLLALPSLALREAQEILPIIDGLRNFGDTDFSCLMLMISEDPQTGIERSLVRSFRRDREDKFLLLIQEPLVKRGQGYLMADDNLWFYDPESRKFSHTSLNEQFNDSEANNSDFGSSSLAEDYTVVRLNRQGSGPTMSCPRAVRKERRGHLSDHASVGHRGAVPRAEIGRLQRRRPPHTHQLLPVVHPDRRTVHGDPGDFP
jgi:hypothetical protein